MSDGTPATARMAAAPGGARPSVIQLVFRERGALYAAYIPLLTEGGLFVPTTREYRLGEDIYLLLSLPDRREDAAAEGEDRRDPRHVDPIGQADADDLTYGANMPSCMSIPTVI